MASKKLALRLGKKYITKGGHIVTPVEKCDSVGCGRIECVVRKNGKNIHPRNALWYMESDRAVKGEHPHCVHYYPDGRLETTADDDSTRKPSAFDVVAIWED